MGEHWRPAQGRDLSKYKPRAAMVDANGDDLMEKINRVAAEMRAASPSNKKDLGQPKAACGIEGPAAKEGRIVVCIDTAGGRGSCNGDSGGPLVQKAGGKAAGDLWTQVGIVSFGASAGCEVGMPAGFTRTEYYLDWIKSETGMP